MTPQEFKTWRKGLGLTQQEAATKLGMGLSMIQQYEAGQRRDDKRPVEIPVVVELATCELTRRIEAARQS
ncbi:MAG: helix-turn-helix domain-containing protein [Rhodospirillaceae bacterium]|nr:helix-turn-helix domain-containing protein [Rhodospirillales bacterium]